MDIETRLEIENLDDLGWTSEEIGDLLDLHPDYVSRILETADKRRKIQELLGEGLNQGEAAEELGISQGRVSALLSGYDYSEGAKELSRRRRSGEGYKERHRLWGASEKGKMSNLEATRRQRETVRGREASREVQRRYYKTEKGKASLQRMAERKEISKLEESGEDESWE